METSHLGVVLENVQQRVDREFKHAQETARILLLNSVERIVSGQLLKYSLAKLMNVEVSKNLAIFQ